MNKEHFKDWKLNKMTVVIGGIIIILVLIYLFVIRPAINQMAVNTYNQGIQYALISMMQEAMECKEIPLTNSNNVTITLFAKECLNMTK